MPNNNKHYVFSLDKNVSNLYTHTMLDSKSSLHSHNFFEFAYIIEGRAINIVNNKEYIMKKGDVFFITPNVSHTIISEKGCLRRDICFPISRFTEVCNSISPELIDKFTQPNFNFFFSIDLNTMTVLEQKLNYFNLKQNKNDLESNTIALSIISELIFNILYDKSSVNDDIPDWMQMIFYRFNHLEFVSQGIPAILQDIHYNEIYINRLFKNITGKNLRNYLTQTRLNISIIYLKTTNYSINEISDMVGFSSPSFYYKCFKDRYNKTPNEYRDNIFSKDELTVNM